MTRIMQSDIGKFTPGTAAACEARERLVVWFMVHGK